VTLTLFLLTVVLPVLAGALLPLLRPGRRVLRAYVAAVTAVVLAAAIAAALHAPARLSLWRVSDALDIAFSVDPASRVFSLLAAGLWLPVGVYAFSYMAHEEREARFFGFYLMAEGALLGMDYAANLVAMYFLFELVTFSSLPLVFHTQSREALAAGLKYLYYSVGGAFLGLLGVVFLTRYAAGLDFVPGGGLLDGAGNRPLLLAVVFAAVVGFSAKAGLYPLHGWLPTAHPAAPAPASAVLSAVIAKAGVLAVLRLLYYVVGPGYLRGTWVQYALLALALLTVFMGSMMAYRENGLKKRLAWSTVSQISYILTGLFLLTAQGLVGGLLHTLFHAVIKTGLFLVAGAVIVRTGRTRVDELRGIGRRMPGSLWGFALLSLALVGIPPFSGFVSKWALAEAALDGGPGALAWLVPVVLLVSALLTAGYLLPIVTRGFFPGRDLPFDCVAAEAGPAMLVPILLTAVLSLALGVGAGPLTDALTAAFAGIGG